MYFNPRLREGGDHLATTYVRWLMYFNPRLREGGDIDAKAKVCPHCQFQSTPPRRRRHNRIKSREEIQNFNPRLREGGDCMASQSSLLLLISIHASAKEATRQFPKKLISPQFQSTPPRRRRPLFLMLYTSLK